MSRTRTAARSADLNLFGSRRMAVAEAQALTVESLRAHGARHDHWVVAWSGGKDSTATLTLVLYLVRSGQVEPPRSITVLYADTRMELPPLAISAQAVAARVREIDASGQFPCPIHVETVVAPLDKRLFVYMLGRGVPPPNNNTLRYCTRQLKIEPMQRAIEAAAARLQGDTVPLTLTGVRLGESAVRDGRIVLACSKNDSECGQGWYQETLPGALTATLAPLLHWRVCNVADWLSAFAPQPAFGGFQTDILVEAYGGDEAMEAGARTGCNGCPLAQDDLALNNLLARYPEKWGYLAPLKRLRPLYRALRLPENRLRKIAERTKSGALSASPNRMGPLTMEARAWGLGEVLAIQAEINAEAARLGRPAFDTLNAEEEARIRELWSLNTWPNGWSGDEPRADRPYEETFSDGTVQPLLFHPDEL